MRGGHEREEHVAGIRLEKGCEGARGQRRVRAEWGEFQAAPGNPGCILRTVSADNHRTGRLPASCWDLYRIVSGAKMVRWAGTTNTDWTQATAVQVLW